MRKFWMMLALVALLLLCSCGAGEEKQESVRVTETTAAETLDGDPWFLADTEEVIMMEPGYPGLVCEGDLREQVIAMLDALHAVIESGQAVEMSEEEAASLEKDCVVSFWINNTARYDDFSVYVTVDGRCLLRWLYMPGEDQYHFTWLIWESEQCAEQIRALRAASDEAVRLRKAS